jgi:hypothetical protein
MDTRRTLFLCEFQTMKNHRNLKVDKKILKTKLFLVRAYTTFTTLLLVGAQGGGGRGDRR